MSRRPRSSDPARASLRRKLHDHGVRPTYGMGQNFMTDPEVADWIVEQLDIRPGDTVLEIGPGTGALTDPILKRNPARAILVEKDAELAAMMRTRVAGHPNVSVIEGDAIRLDTRPFFRFGPLKVIGALPYSCGTEIIRHLMRNPSPAGRAIFTLQKEVCDKLAAQPGDRHYGLLTLRSQARWIVRFLRKLPPDLFLPRPDVDSGVVSMEPRPRDELPVFDERALDRLLAAGFSQRRKMLRNLLPPGARPWPELAAAAAAGIPELARGQELTLRQWVELVNLHSGAADAPHAQRDDEQFDIVDEQNRVIRQESRRIVHRDGLRHRAVHILVENARGEIFLQKRSHLKDTMPGRWDSSAAGHLDAGEDFRTAAVRELREELAVDTTPDALRFVARLDASPSTGQEFVELFATSWDGPVRCPAAEIECGEWFPPSEIDAWSAARPEDFAPGFLECWNARR